MDPITTSIAVSSATSVVTEAFRKDAVEFLQKVFRKGWSLAEGFFSEQVYEWRRENAIITLGLAHQRLRDIGVEPAEVAPQILLPLLEAASLQDGEDLRSMWANLLANAADPRNQVETRPRFVSILRDLSVSEAKFFDVLCMPQPVLGQALTDTQILQAASSVGIARWQSNVAGYNGFSSMPDFKEGRAAIAATLDNLCAFGLMDGIFNVTPIDLGGIPKIIARAKIELELNKQFRLTQLGAEFIIACRAPVKV